MSPLKRPTLCRCMEWLHKVFTTIEPFQFIYGLAAVCGGMARYLNEYANGKPFSIGHFLASAFVAGFSGWMFAITGTSMELPQGLVFVMAGSGGFFGEQTMRLIMEYSRSRTNL